MRPTRERARMQFIRAGGRVLPTLDCPHSYNQDPVVPYSHPPTLMFLTASLTCKPVRQTPQKSNKTPTTERPGRAQPVPRSLNQPSNAFAAVDTQKASKSTSDLVLNGQSSPAFVPLPVS